MQSGYLKPALEGNAMGMGFHWGLMVLNEHPSPIAVPLGPALFP